MLGLSARQPPLDKANGAGRPLGLKDIVKIACREYECREYELIRVNKDRIFWFKDLAGTALHRRETSLEDKAMERATARFMKLLAALIQSAPEGPEDLES